MNYLIIDKLMNLVIFTKTVKGLLAGVLKVQSDKVGEGAEAGGLHKPHGKIRYLKD